MRLAGALEAGRRRCRVRCCLCWLLVAAEASCLVFPQPRGSATKVQLIFGLGVPMELDASTIVGYVIKCNYELPYNASYLGEPHARRRRSARGGSEEPVAEPAGGMGRNDLYRMLEMAISSGSRSEGKPCLLRAICEAAATPLDTRHGLSARMLHAFLTPSSTAEPIDQEYLAAERMGARGGTGNRCERAFAECRANFLRYFSKIH